MKVPANPNKRLRNREKPGGLAGSYRHLLGVYVIIALIRWQKENDCPALIDDFEGDVGDSSTCWVELANLEFGEADFSSGVIMRISAFY